LLHLQRKLLVSQLIQQQTNHCVVAACKNYGVALNLLHQYAEAVEVYNKGVTILEEKVDIEHEQNKLNLKDVVNLLTYLTNRIFVLRFVLVVSTLIVL
jgi:hypothetical protein